MSKNCIIEKNYQMKDGADSFIYELKQKVYLINCLEPLRWMAIFKRMLLKDTLSDDSIVYEYLWIRTNKKNKVNANTNRFFIWSSNISFFISKIVKS